MSEFELALNSYLDEMLSFARSRIKDPQLAADAVQDSLLKALNHKNSLRQEHSLRAWLYQILRNTINDLYRKNKRHFTEPIDDPDSLAEQEELERIACRCIEKLLPALNKDYAYIIRELELRQQPVKEISAQLKITPNNLKVKRHRARQQLKQRLEQTCRLCAAHGCLDCDCDSND
ncbi:MAG TPA: sigma-70 family RNA polymerase sigma factor [Caldithrix abyssi]|uniref:Sigma-70 family RNA polymerase sigma factor n=1 Tax=Caldithrix abyssi TaxID=187145 RepID=A0A7V1LJB9_CALAY|nr:sigma-70 family RNA polymerase sigma factor [Caldithrix abyssi]